jgi:hypothetical protein
LGRDPTAKQKRRLAAHGGSASLPRSAATSLSAAVIDGSRTAVVTISTPVSPKHNSHPHRCAALRHQTGARGEGTIAMVASAA